MSDPQDVAMLLTATITPPTNCPDLKRNNPNDRLTDYANALKFYLTIDSLSKIIFVENSDSDLGPLQDLVDRSATSKKVEFISHTNGNIFPPEFGKGYGEMTMLNYALDHSKLIDENTRVWKGTGRLILSNIDKLIKTAPGNYLVYCDLHNAYPMLSLGHFFDPRFYSFCRAGYERFFRLPNKKLEYQYIEQYYFEALKSAADNKLVVPRFKIQPFIDGYSGSANTSYSSWKKNLQRSAQQILRVAAPRIWL